jgi:hypothetical protein
MSRTMKKPTHRMSLGRYGSSRMFRCTIDFRDSAEAPHCHPHQLAPTAAKVGQGTGLRAEAAYHREHDRKSHLALRIRVALIERGHEIDGSGSPRLTGYFPSCGVSPSTCIS